MFPASRSYAPSHESFTRLSSDSEPSSSSAPPLTPPGSRTACDPRLGDPTFTSRLRPSAVTSILPAPNPHQELSSYTFLGDDGKLYEISYRVQTASGVIQKCMASRETWQAHADQLKEQEKRHGGLLQPGCDKDIKLEKDAGGNFYLTTSGYRHPVTEQFAQSYFAIPTYNVKEPITPATSSTAAASAPTSTAPATYSGRLLNKKSTNQSSGSDESGSEDSDTELRTPSSSLRSLPQSPLPQFPISSSAFTGIQEPTHVPARVDNVSRPPLPAGRRVRNIKTPPGSSPDDKPASPKPRPDAGLESDDLNFVAEDPIPSTPATNDNDET